MSMHVVIVLSLLTFAGALECNVLAEPGNAHASPTPAHGVRQGFSIADSQQQVVMQPEPLSSNEPRAKQARAIVELILKGDRTALVKLLETESAPAFAKGGDFDTAVDAQLERLANKGYAIVQMMTGRGADVFVELESSKAEPTNVVIRFTADPPHRVEGFTQARMVAGR